MFKKGYKMSQTHKDRIAVANKGQKRSQDAKDRMSAGQLRRKPFTEETLANMRAGQANRTQESRDRQAESCIKTWERKRKEAGRL